MHIFFWNRLYFVCIVCVCVCVCVCVYTHNADEKMYRILHHIYIHINIREYTFTNTTPPTHTNPLTHATLT